MYDPEFLNIGTYIFWLLIFDSKLQLFALVFSLV
jgi:hypothetical protein